jgi:hypothetical protein
MEVEKPQQIEKPVKVVTPAPANEIVDTPSIPNHVRLQPAEAKQE